MTLSKLGRFCFEKLGKIGMLSISKFVNACFVLPQVNFMSKSFPTVPYTNPDCASLRILSKLLTWKYLHREIREKGGAYGGGANGSTDGSFSFYSYRDPRSMETLEVYDNSINWASQGTFTEADVAEAKMSLFQQMDKPVAPGSRGVQFSISKLTDEQRQVHRNQILTSTKSDLLRVCNQYLKHSDGTVSFLGPKNEKVDERWNIIKFD
jgi:Zn-dependent M16 (insulinase) family peptidase